MKSKITYFMEKDTRLITDNLSKVIINEDMILIKYTAFRRNLDDLTFTAIRYYKSKNRIFIYDKLKKYNPNVYEAFIEWANEKEISWYSFEEKMIEEVDYGL